MSNRPGGGPQPSTTYSFEVDPCAILGIEASASLQEIRDAYRSKAMKYHPDHGGDEWVFRIVARAYEIMSTARVAGRASQEGRGRAPASRPAPAQPSPSSAQGESEWLRPGRRDPWIDALRMVDVEVLVLRLELRDPSDLVLLPAEERNLSCSLHVTWTPPPRAASGDEHPDVALVRRLLTETFTAMPSKTKAISSWSNANDETFEGWLSYPSAIRAWEAFRAFHEALNSCGLGVNQWTRELIIPRGGR